MLCLVLWGKSSIYTETLAFLATRILPLFRTVYTSIYTVSHEYTLPDLLSYACAGGCRVAAQRLFPAVPARLLNPDVLSPCLLDLHSLAYCVATACCCSYDVITWRQRCSAYPVHTPRWPTTLSIPVQSHSHYMIHAFLQCYTRHKPNARRPRRDVPDTHIGSSALPGIRLLFTLLRFNKSYNIVRNNARLTVG